MKFTAPAPNFFHNFQNYGPPGPYYEEAYYQIYKAAEIKKPESKTEISGKISNQNEEELLNTQTVN